MNLLTKKLIQTLIVLGLFFSVGLLADSVQNIKTDIDSQVIKQEIMADLQRETATTATTTATTEVTPPKMETKVEAVQAPVKKSSSTIGMYDYLKVIGSLAGILGLFIICVALVRKASKKIKKTNNLQMEIISRMPVAAKRELILARVGDETILIGSSEAGLNFMTTIDSVGNFQPRVPNPKYESPAEEALTKLEMKDNNDYRTKLKSKMGKYKPLQ